MKPKRPAIFIVPPPAIAPPPPWNHQLKMERWALDRRGSLLAACMGGGKTRSTFRVAAQSPAVRFVLVASPPPPVTDVWPAQLTRFAERPWTVAMLDDRAGSIANRAATLVRAHEFAARETEQRLLAVVNYEALWREPLATTVFRMRPHMLVADECHKAKAPGSRTSFYLGRVAPYAKRVVGLSGTPMGKGPLDMYGQARFIDPSAFVVEVAPGVQKSLAREYALFCARYAVIDNGSGREVIVGYQRAEEFAERCARFMLEITRAEADLNLPPTRDISVRLDMPAAAWSAYESMNDDLVADVEGGTVTAANGGVKILRLQQMTSGFVPLDVTGQSLTALENAPLRARLHEAKTAWLVEMLDDLPPDEAVVVYVRFKPDLEEVRRAAAKAGRGYAEVSGARKELGAWQLAAQQPTVLGVQLQAGALGLDFTRSAYGVYYSTTFDRIVYEQSRMRIDRPGQTRPVTYYHLTVRNSVDGYIRAALAEYGDVVALVLQAIARSGNANQATPDEEVSTA